MIAGSLALIAAVAPFAAVVTIQAVSNSSPFGPVQLSEIPPRPSGAPSPRRNR